MLKKKKIERKKRQKKVEEPKEENVPRKKKSISFQDHSIKIAAKKFFHIMENTTTFVDPLELLDKLGKQKCDLHGNPYTLWRIWKQVEVDFPYAVEFIPQSSLFWRSKPSGWKYIGPPQYDAKRKRKRLK